MGRPKRTQVPRAQCRSHHAPDLAGAAPTSLSAKSNLVSLRSSGTYRENDRRIHRLRPQPQARDQPARCRLPRGPHYAGECAIAFGGIAVVLLKSAAPIVLGVASYPLFASRSSCGFGVVAMAALMAALMATEGEGQ